ncbi:hypothetical protein E2C01_080799 [Portunus trituberculatus]|uniref:Uncharacterized protein n=1 Tax=Portunus trituberculatus TaxID=210409 RepID=A0A5B7IN86_PORTR|nr:hypothetical protein [Portunus trituberculatus]
MDNKSDIAEYFSVVVKVWIKVFKKNSSNILNSYTVQHDPHHLPRQADPYIPD